MLKLWALLKFTLYKLRTDKITRLRESLFLTNLILLKINKLISDKPDLTYMFGETGQIFIKDKTKNEMLCIIRVTSYGYHINMIIAKEFANHFLTVSLNNMLNKYKRGYLNLSFNCIYHDLEDNMVYIGEQAENKKKRKTSKLTVVK